MFYAIRPHFKPTAFNVLSFKHFAAVVTKPFLLPENDEMIYFFLG